MWLTHKVYTTNHYHLSYFSYSLESNIEDLAMKLMLTHDNDTDDITPVSLAKPIGENDR